MFVISNYILLVKTLVNIKGDSTDNTALSGVLTESVVRQRVPDPTLLETAASWGLPPDKLLYHTEF